MAHLIHVWHERNGWSHKVLPALAETLDLGRVHNSQISNLRNGKLAAPGPEVFLALGQSNYVLNRGLAEIHDLLMEIHPELLKVLLESSIPLLADNEEPISAGQFFEIFIGLTPLPASFDWFIEENEAIGISAALSEFFCHGRQWRQCREEILEAYPVKKVQRRDKFAAVMAGLRDYTAEELDGELFDLYYAYKALGGCGLSGANGFLKDLRLRAEILKAEPNI
tara:strand:+ start:1073 stop:1744 length:672 start_codon:yes stop_codon:yes gene_type:complete